MTTPPPEVAEMRTIAERGIMLPRWRALFIWAACRIERCGCGAPGAPAPTDDGRAVAEHLHRMAQEEASRIGVGLALIQGRSRKPTVVAAKQAICKALRARGLSYPEIAEAAGVSGSTAYESVKGRKRAGARSPGEAGAGMEQANGDGH